MEGLDIEQLPEVVEFGFVIARDHFGDHVGRVAKSVHGVGKTLRMIVEHTKLGFRDVRNALLVLMQHSIVQIKTEGQGETQQEFYVLVIKALLVRTRFPRFMERVYDHYVDESPELAEAARAVVQHVCLHGRISTADLLRDLVQQQGDPEQGDAWSRKLLEQAVHKLSSNQFVVQATANQSKPAPEEPASGGKKPGARAKRPTISKALQGLGAKKRKVTLGSAKDMPLEMQMLIDMGSGGNATTAKKEDTPAIEGAAPEDGGNLELPDAIWAIDPTTFALHARCVRSCHAESY